MRETPFLPKDSYQSASDILTHLQKVKRLGDGRYIALCPCHNDRNPSLGVTLKPDGKWLIRCFSCGAKGIDVCNTLGIDPISLYPSNNNPRYEKQKRSGFSALQLMNAMEADLVRLLIIANDLNAIDALSDDDREFVSEVVIRINDGLQYLEGKK
jgi:hypothetical protein